MTNLTFTRAATELAEKLEVELWDHCPTTRYYSLLFKLMSLMNIVFFFIWNSVVVFYTKQRYLFFSSARWSSSWCPSGSCFSLRFSWMAICSLQSGSRWYLSVPVSPYSFVAGNHQCGLFRYPAACSDSDSCLFIACLLACGAQTALTRSPCCLLVAYASFPPVLSTYCICKKPRKLNFPGLSVFISCLHIVLWISC